jgi:hypothetical protein
MDSGSMKTLMVDDVVIASPKPKAYISVATFKLNSNTECSV